MRSFDINVATVLRTVVCLVVASLLVGILLAVFRIHPIKMWMSLWHWVQNGLVDLIGTGIEGIGLVVTLIVTGAIVVLPIWAIGKLLGSRKD